MTTVSPTESDILKVLGDFIVNVIPGLEVVVGQDNGVPEPSQADFVVMTHVFRERLATNYDAWDTANPAPVALTHEHSTQISYQLDIHGPNSTDNAQIIATLLRDGYACDFMAPFNVQPLYASDGKQVPFINGEGRYENRWIVTAELQANPVVSTAQQFAHTLTAGLINVDVAYPP